MTTAAPAPPDAAATAVLACEHVSVVFDGTRALDDVSLTLHAGEVIGMVGANGAGKSTLGRAIAGELPANVVRGRFVVDGRPVALGDAAAARAAGIALIHQEKAAIPALSVGENVMMSIEPRTRVGSIDWERLHAQAREHLALVGLDVDTRRPLGEAGGHVQHLAEVARAFARGSRLLVFDESTASLGVDEVRLLLERMRELRDRGATVVFVSHRLDEVLAVSDRLVVLRDGRIVHDGPRAGLDHDAVVRLMLGSQYRALESQPAGAAGEQPALSLRNWVVPSRGQRKLRVGPLDLEVRRGEVVGLYGTPGAGKTELLSSIFGLYGSEPQGELRIGERVAVPRHPAAAIRHGLALIPAERRGAGILTGRSVRENMLVSRPQGIDRGGLLRAQAADRLCEELVEALGIKLAGIDTAIDHLSGGNQQKVLLARALAMEPQLLMLDEPTRGVDVGAKADVYELVRTAARQGTACLLASIEADEVLAICDRIVVMRDGHIVVELAAERTDEHELIRSSTGGEVSAA